MVARAVLIAIAIPTFTGQLEKSREATDKANLRAAYSEVVTAWLEDGATHSVTVNAQQTDGSKWEGESGNVMIAGGITSGSGASAEQSGFEAAPSTKGWTVSIDATGKVTCTVQS